MPVSNEYKQISDEQKQEYKARAFDIITSMPQTFGEKNDMILKVMQPVMNRITQEHSLIEVSNLLKASKDTPHVASSIAARFLNDLIHHGEEHIIEGTLDLFEKIIDLGGTLPNLDKISGAKQVQQNQQKSKG